MRGSFWKTMRARADGDAQAQRRLARPGPRRYARDRSHVCAAANPAKAQDRPSATRNHHQNTSDRDDLGNAQDECARLGGVCPTVEDPAFEVTSLFEDELVAIL